MNSEELLHIVSDWSFWDNKVPEPEPVPRRLELPRELSDKYILVIQGVRRSGKSTLMSQLMAEYDLEPTHCAFINFEDPRLSNSLHFETLETLVKSFSEKHPETKRLFFFLDEIQGVSGWEKWLRTQLERPSGNVFVVTGSNASLLSGELGSVLTGRHIPVELFPFDLEEARDLVPQMDLETFLHEGGFPEPLQTKNGDLLRQQYFHDIVERDVRERVGARSSQPLRQLVQMVYETCGSELSMNKAAAATSMAVDTASSYLTACEDAYLLFRVPYFAFSERKRSNRNAKFYPIDTGLRRVVVTATGSDYGKHLECATFLKLRKRYGDVYYWKGQGEVDFVVRDGSDVLPFQVTWDEPRPRHHAALREFYEEFPNAREESFVTRENFELL
jgi:predicted AAA+ superfamily ATPase